MNNKDVYHSFGSKFAKFMAKACNITVDNPEAESTLSINGQQFKVKVIRVEKNKTIKRGGKSCTLTDTETGEVIKNVQLHIKFDFPGVGGNMYPAAQQHKQQHRQMKQTAQTAQAT